MVLSELYPELQHQLSRLDAQMDATECHGVLCARFCIESRPDPAIWVQEVIGDQDGNNLQVQASQVSLAHLYQHTERSFHTALEDFELFMPDDEEVLSIRTQALVDWCGGFVSGLGLSGLQVDDTLDAEVQEIMQDLMEVTRMDVDIEDNDENEAAFTEIEEYVRIGVMTIGLTLMPRENQPTLH